MKKKRFMLVVLAMTLVIPSFLVEAAPATTSSETDEQASTDGKVTSKEEVVYAKLAANGELEDVYVVNTLNVSEAGKIIDYGTYNSLNNLTDMSQLTRNDEHVEVEAPEGRFYYQGNMNDETELPWDLSITSWLDGEEITPDELAGKEGSLELKIETSANEAVDPAFFENYLVQISLTLEEEIYSNIETEEGVVANSGKNKQITFTVMPEQEEELSLRADVVDFELEGMEIAAVPSSMSIDAPDLDEMTGDIDSLTDGVLDIHNGVGELKNGIAELNDGIRNLHSGSEQYKNGIGELAGSSSQLVSASSSIDEALTTISQSLQVTDDIDLGDLESLPGGLTQIASGLNEAAEGLTLLREHYSVAYSTLDEAINEIPDHHISEEEIQALYESGANSEVIEQLVDTYGAAQKAKGTYAAVKEGFDAVDGTLQEVSGGISEMSSSLTQIATGLSSSLDNMDGMDSLAQLEEGLSTLSANYGEFHSGLVSYTNGVGELSSSYNDLHSGITGLSGGTTELENGAGELHNGTNQLYEATSNIPEHMQEEVDRMIAEFDKSDFEAVSFVSDKNENVNSVQFVIKTEGIKIEEREEVVEEIEEEKTFWSRLMDLFSRG
ncbi:YhgE/Pip domain-containing protein [Alkalihalophilus lindianensis]|uniref:YhgE/Pip domain-containing protein n=1 Tax=Alkalihalophilus lindianensis TaxID=1630542 RepID=A0ABU3XE41_9BACI|nr:YhgE/Pip domain-containing protein [Alkalihalophilus lindianensis]MDV2686151.1 YhgE/Pip domain-containing protein [Alkalihalophilus lindianensis]